jgi:hypothetical protein
MSPRGIARVFSFACSGIDDRLRGNHKRDGTAMVGKTVEEPSAYL